MQIITKTYKKRKLVSVQCAECKTIFPAKAKHAKYCKKCQKIVWKRYGKYRYMKDLGIEVEKLKEEEQKRLQELNNNPPVDFNKIVNNDWIVKLIKKHGEQRINDKTGFPISMIRNWKNGAYNPSSIQIKKLQEIFD